MSLLPDKSAHANPGALRPDLRRPAVRYAVAVVAVAAAVGGRGLLSPVIGGEALPFMFLFPAVVAAAWYGGTGPALVTVVLGGAVADWFFIPPVGSLVAGELPAVLALVVFIAVGLCLVAAIRAMHRANARAREQLAERDRADRAMRESEERFRTMADGLPLFVWVHSAQDGQLFVNHTYCEFFGVSREEMTGKRWEKLLHPEDADAYRAEFVRCLETREAFHAQARVLRADGQWRCVESWARPRWSPAGDFFGFVGASVDVTDRVANESALHESQERLRLALAGASMGVWSWKMDTNTVEWSPEVYRLFGIDHFAGTAEAFRAMLHPDDAAGVWETLQEAIGQHQPYTCEYRIVRSDGATRWMHDRGRADYLPNGQPHRMLGVVIDITEHRRAQEQLERARDQALAASRAKDQFLAALSHELRTPLTPALIVSTELEQSPLTPPELREQCATVRASIELEARLIDDLLDTARVARGKMHMVFGTCDPHLALRQAVEIVQAEFTAKHITLDWELDLAPATVSGDVVRLQQVFWNLLRNAAKFTPNDGGVALRTCVAGGMWRLEVVDSGVGIAAADLERVFENFVQVGRGSEAQLRGGLGLGLPISAFIVREHGGRIWAESPGLGRGSTFIVELPLTTAPVEQDGGGGTPAARPATPLRILLVEDHAPTRQAFQALLTRRGHTVIAAEGIVQARAEAAARKFDVLMSDLGLADGSGLQLMRELREVHGLYGVALSGYAMDVDVQGAMDAGFLIHLTKPVKLQRLDEALVEVGETVMRARAEITHRE